MYGDGIYLAPAQMSPEDNVATVQRIGGSPQDVEGEEKHSLEHLEHSINVPHHVAGAMVAVGSKDVAYGWDLLQLVTECSLLLPPLYGAIKQLLGGSWPALRRRYFPKKWSKAMPGIRSKAF
ncbi:GL15254 [Drosophila persimilis]|uniref:GL15254 n=1 Tax=Drosophila persimilis TaxID=7234 RepID=B4H3W2_DROPE|nr:GL15254 [Drosophila persimilis]